MQVKIPLPTGLLDWIARRWEPIGDWLNVPLVPFRRVRRIDVLILLLGIGVVSYYGWATGWQGALSAGLLYALFVMIGLWFL